jgi:hypothetical protein
MKAVIWQCFNNGNTVSQLAFQHFVMCSSCL